MAWKDFQLTSGSRDRTIVHHDSREKNRGRDNTAWSIRRKHTQEVCGLKWNRGTQWLASGGNDNKLYIWDERRLGTIPGQETELHDFTEHQAAVKAIAWSPHHVRTPPIVFT